MGLRSIIYGVGFKSCYMQSNQTRENIHDYLYEFVPFAFDNFEFVASEVVRYLIESNELCITLL